jgi:hypothetical protein
MFSGILVAHAGSAFLMALLALAFVFRFRVVVSTYTTMVFIAAHKYLLLWLFTWIVFSPCLCCFCATGLLYRLVR